MSNDLNLAGEPLAAAVTWFLDTFITPAVDAGKVALWRKKIEFDWGDAAESYRAHLLALYGTVRVLGATHDAPLDDLFTDLYILDHITARRRFNLQALQEQGHDDFRRKEDESKRTNGVALVRMGQNLYILGKPGAGKTTFLKYITVQAAQWRAIQRIPIFVSLHDWAMQGEGDLVTFIVHRFNVCGFPDAADFVEQLLVQGKGLLLFDGLDEVKQEAGQRMRLTSLLQDFVDKYSKNSKIQVLITCRLAADQYIFRGFDEVEVADFTEAQVEMYAHNWFATAPEKLALFLAELSKHDHKGVRELCNTPLLLSLICLAFDDNLRLGESRIDIYENALDALLRRWDASRSRQRDATAYGKLRPQQKMKILAAIAAQTFERGEYFLRQRELEELLSEQLAQLPNASPKSEIDGLDVLRAIEAQHSLLVERAAGIYSFSHLTLQEYFTAWYIKENGRIPSLMSRLTDNRWREVFLMTASLLANADEFFEQMRQAIDRLLVDNPGLMQLLRWANTRADAAQAREEQGANLRFAYIFLARARPRALDLARARGPASGHTLEIDSARAPAYSLAHALDFDLDRALARTHDLDIARDLANNLSIELGFDYMLYYVRATATLFAREKLDREESTVNNALASYPTLLAGAVDLAQQAGRSDLAQQLSHLPVPVPTASAQGWQQFADRLWRVLQTRGLAQDWQFTKEQSDKLRVYFAANELLVQCLKGAVVTDRQAILAGLLSPPAGED